MRSQISALAVFAHPDDESFSCGGTLARLAAEGVEVNLLCATSGEVGEISDPALASKENLGEVRREELRAAAQVLGAREPYFMGYRDSGMAGTPENHDPRSLAQVPLDVVGGKVLEFIKRLRPQVVMTFDQGGAYGHPDHVAVHHATRWALEHLADDDHDVLPSCYYTALPRGRLLQLMEEARSRGIPPPRSRINLEALGIPDEMVTTVVDVGPFVEVKLQAIRSHRTQINPDNPLMRLPDDLLRKFLGQEHFILAPNGERRDWLARFG